MGSPQRLDFDFPSMPRAASSLATVPIQQSPIYLAHLPSTLRSPSLRPVSGARNERISEDAISANLVVALVLTSDSSCVADARRAAAERRSARTPTLTRSYRHHIEVCRILRSMGIDGCEPPQSTSAALRIHPPEDFYGAQPYELICEAPARLSNQRISISRRRASAVPSRTT